MFTSTTAVAPSGPGNRYFDIAGLHGMRTCLGRLQADRLLDNFAEALPLYSSRLEEAAARSDLAAVARTAHALRGTAISFGCPGLSRLCESVKASCERGDVEEFRRSAKLLIHANGRAVKELQMLRALSTGAAA